MRVLNKCEDNEIWDKVQEKTNYPNKIDEKFKSSMPFKEYKIPFWNEQQEKLINKIFCSVSSDDILAIDWQHDGFIYNPSENFPLNTHWYDAKRDCNVYFPSYFPDGDYFAFISKDLTYGLYGNPWRMEIYVVGMSLIELFEKHKEELEIEEIKKKKNH